MKVVLIFMISLITFASAQEFIAGRNVSEHHRSSRSVKLVPADFCKNIVDVKSFCLEQGSCAESAKIFICNAGPDSAKPLEYDCPKDKPFCVGEAGRQGCSVNADPSCPSTNKLCKSPGYYPDPSNCYLYYYCFEDATVPTAKVIKSYTIECPLGAPFNPAGPQDRKCQVGGKCVTTNCTKDLVDEWRPMNYTDTMTNRVVVKCANGIVDYVKVCPAGLSLDLTTGECAIKCLTNYQKAVYEADEQKYYLCLMGKGYLRRCEVGQKFNAEKLECM